MIGSLQSQNVYFNSETSSLHWNLYSETPGDNKIAFLHCGGVLALQVAAKLGMGVGTWGAGGSNMRSAGEARPAEASSLCAQNLAAARDPGGAFWGHACGPSRHWQIYPAAHSAGQPAALHTCLSVLKVTVDILTL